MTKEEKLRKGREYQRQYRLDHAEECSERNKEWAKNNRDKMNEYQRNYERRGPAVYMLIHARARAKKKGIEFNIELEDIIIPEFCPYLGVKFSMERCRTPANRPSLDRIDPTKGYIKGNVRVISQRANTMKSNATNDELIFFAENIFRLHRKE